jgi:colanic acid/amylovoran biosynthesis glycosyltransferase
MPEAVINPASRPIVASYCATFLKPEMLHIYRQVTGLQHYKTFVITRERLGEQAFPFSDIESLPRVFSPKRFYLKYILKMPPLCYRGELQQLMALFQRRPADLMHIYFGEIGVHLLPFIQAWSAPCVVSFHGMDIRPRPQTPGYDDSMREMLRTAPLVLARSESLLAGLERLGCPKEKLRLNRTGIPLGQFPFRQRALPPDGEWRFVQACRLIPKKGLATALRAFAKFHEKYPRAKFEIAGEGPMKSELEAMIAELDLTGAVELTGFLAQPELRALYDRSHVFLHPSEMPPDQNQEGVPNSMLEAMATGLPVLATTHGGIPEAVTHERSGLLVAERDAEALFRAMCRVAAEPDLYVRLGSAASRAVREAFEHGKQIEKLESYYDEARELFKKQAPRND